MVYTFRGGIHPGTHADPGYKAATNTKPIEAMPAPEQVILPVSMHIGAPAKPIVKKGDIVDMGQMIAEAGGFVSAPVHATVSGKVIAVEPRLHPNGSKVMSIVIENDGEDRLHESVHPYDFAAMSNDERIETIRSAGMVGHGGATFPTHVKIKGAIGCVDTVLVNAAECEPYITSDHRLLLERPEEIVGGLKMLCDIIGAKSGIISASRSTSRIPLQKSRSSSKMTRVCICIRSSASIRRVRKSSSSTLAQAERFRPASCRQTQAVQYLMWTPQARFIAAF